MSNSRLSSLTGLSTPAAADVVYIVDVSDTTDNAAGSSRKSTLTELFSQADTINTNLVTLTGTQTLTNKTLTAPRFVQSGFIADSNGNELLEFVLDASAVNHIVIENNATGTAPFLWAAGDNTNVSLDIGAKGTGNITFFSDSGAREILTLSSSAIAVNAITIESADATFSPSISATGEDTNISLLFSTQGTTGGYQFWKNAFGTLLAEFLQGGDLSLETSTANIQINNADPKRTMYVPASAMYPSTTAGCAALTQVESSTNDVNIKVLDFDGAGTSKESAEFGIQSPSYWDASTVTVQFIWYATAGSGTVNWEAQAVAFSDDDALDAAFGTLQEVTDTLLATGDVHITAETSAITVGGTPVAGDWVNFRVNRDPANDTNTSDCRLMGVRIRFGIKQYNDA